MLPESFVETVRKVTERPIATTAVTATPQIDFGRNRFEGQYMEREKLEQAHSMRVTTDLFPAGESDASEIEGRQLLRKVKLRKTESCKYFSSFVKWESVEVGKQSKSPWMKWIQMTYV
jgi:hypothetical protein